MNLPLVVLVVTIVVVGCLLALSMVGLLIGKDKARLRYFKAAGIVTFGYAVLLFSFSFASRRNILRVGQTQCFGNWCTTVEKAFFEDKRVFITLRVGSLTKSGEVRPVNPRIQVIDSQGNAFGPVKDFALPLDLPLQSGWTLDRAYHFYLLPVSERPVVEVSEGEWYTFLVISHPNSPFHQRPFTPID